jgi:hypothetical protein
MFPKTSTGAGVAPYTVAIVAMGPSHSDYTKECANLGGRINVADETWAINAMANVIDHDRAIIMDDLEYFGMAGREHSHLAGYSWLQNHPGPIYTSRVTEKFKGAVEFPLREMLDKLGYQYFNNTCAYAIGLAMLIGVRHMKIYGMDFTNREGSTVEAGRACVEFWLSRATMSGTKVTIAPSSTLCDQHIGRKLYGYA